MIGLIIASVLAAQTVGQGGVTFGTSPSPTPGQYANQAIIGSASTTTSACLSLTANPKSGGTPLTVNFTGSGFEGGMAISMYEFDFGDTSGGQLRVVRQQSSAATHKYNTPGTYTAKLRVQTSTGSPAGEWKGSANCEQTITVSAGRVTELPETGPKENLAAVTVIGIIGVILQKKFRLIH